jgi:hypothetical protein
MFAKRMLLIAVAAALLATLTGCGRRCFCRDSGTSYRAADPCDPCR